MKTPPFTALWLGAAVACAPAQAQAPADADALRSGLTDMLSTLSLGSVSVADQPPQVTRSGNDFHIQLPLNGFAAPAGASAQAVARSAADGVWDVISMTFPSAGALGNSIDQVVSYTVAKQAIHGRIDVRLATPSTFDAELGTVTLQTASGSQTSEQSIEHMTFDATLSGGPSNRVDLAARDSASRWHVVARDPAGVESNNLVQRVTGRVSVTGLDRAQGGRLIAAARSFAAGTRTSPRQGDLSPAALGGLAEMLDATDGLLTRLDADETFSGLSFQLANGNAGTLGKIQMHVESSAEDKQLNAGTDIALDELSLTSVSTDTAAFLPHHVTARSVLAGMPIGPLKAWLRAAVAPGADPALLQKQAATILAIPGTKAAIESVAFDAGPLHVRGAVHFVPRANGEIGADIHISATGMDALLAQVQKRPSVQGMLPMLFLAKGMGRGQGDSIVWDIGLGGGPVTINGTPFGQPAGNTR